MFTHAKITLEEYGNVKSDVVEIKMTVNQRRDKFTGVMFGINLDDTYKRAWERANNPPTVNIVVPPDVKHDGIEYTSNKEEREVEYMGEFYTDNIYTDTMKLDVNYSIFESTDKKVYTLKDTLNQGYRYNNFYEDSGLDISGKKKSKLYIIKKYKRYLFDITLIVNNQDKGTVKGYIDNEEKCIIDPVNFFQLIDCTISSNDAEYIISGDNLLNGNKEAFIPRYKYGSLLLDNVTIAEIEKVINCKTEWDNKSKTFKFYLKKQIGLQKGRYSNKYIDFIKSYETHKKNGDIHILSNDGQTIAYGHDLSTEEIKSGIYKNGMTEDQAIKLLINDLDEKYDTITRYIKTLNNTPYNYSIDIGSFTDDELYFLLDFAFNRGKGFVKREELEGTGKPYSSLAILIVAVFEKNDELIINTLKEETKNTKGIYYSGLELRRMDQYEIYKHGDYTRSYDIDRGYN